MDKDDIINYVMETPGNSNPAVLGSMLESYSGGSSSNLPDVTSTDNGKVLGVVNGKWDKTDKGWDLTEIQLFSETITMQQEKYGYVANLTYNHFIDYPFLKVTFDGIEYTCPKITDPNNIHACTYGAQHLNNTMDFSEYPFSIGSFLNSTSTPVSVSNFLSTETGGVHTLLVNGVTPAINPEFEAVLSSNVVKNTFEIIPGVTTYAEALDAFQHGKAVFIYYGQYEKAIALYVGFDQQNEDTIVIGIRVDGSGNIYYLKLHTSDDGILR